MWGNDNHPAGITPLHKNNLLLNICTIITLGIMLDCFNYTWCKLIFLLHSFMPRKYKTFGKRATWLPANLQLALDSVKNGTAFHEVRFRFNGKAQIEKDLYQKNTKLEKWGLFHTWWFVWSRIRKLCPENGINFIIVWLPSNFIKLHFSWLSRTMSDTSLIKLQLLLAKIGFMISWKGIGF